jgi:hypothetical protein
MMPMLGRRKARQMEKVEILCRTAVVWIFLPPPLSPHGATHRITLARCRRHSGVELNLHSPRSGFTAHRAGSIAARNKPLSGVHRGLESAKENTRFLNNLFKLREASCDAALWALGWGIPIRK